MWPSHDFRCAAALRKVLEALATAMRTHASDSAAAQLKRRKARDRARREAKSIGLHPQVVRDLLADIQNVVDGGSPDTGTTGGGAQDCRH